MALDLRLLKIQIEVEGSIKEYSDLNIVASGSKYANSLQNEAHVQISNLDKDTLNYILTQTTPFNLYQQRKKISIFAGRESYGLSKVYEGDVVSSSVSQPPDITINLKCLTGNFFKGSILSIMQPGITTLKNASAQTAQSMGLTLDFQATDKNIGNYSYSGSALKQVDYLNSAGNVNAYVDDNLLILKNSFVPLNGQVTQISENNGMVGIPELTEQGIKAKFFFNGKTTVGSKLIVTSKIYPAANGEYIIYKLDFDLANRTEPFYYIAEAATTRRSSLI